MNCDHVMYSDCVSRQYSGAILNFSCEEAFHFLVICDISKTCNHSNVVGLLFCTQCMKLL